MKLKNIIKTGRLKFGSYEVSEAGKNAFVLRVEGKIYVKNAGSVLKTIKSAIDSLSPGEKVDMLTIDLENVLYMDDFGALAISGISRIPSLKESKVEIVSADSGTLSVINSFDRDRKNNRRKLSFSGEKYPGILERTGECFLNRLAGARDMISFTGEVVIAFFYACLHPKSFRFRDMMSCIEKTGVNALPVIALSSFLLGLIIAFMSSLQLRQFGANLYVASLVAMSMISELGPVMTAIIVSGRTGSAFAAEIGSMKISEETEALFAMGFNPVLFLAVLHLRQGLIKMMLF